MTKDETLKLALDALGTVRPWEVADYDPLEKAITALRQALEQEPWDTSDMAHRAGGLSMGQEPVYAFRRKGLDDFCTCDKRRYDELASKPDLFEVAVFYAAPPKREWVELTDDEIAESAERMEAIDPTDYFWRDFARAIEAKLKEKNT